MNLMDKFVIWEKLNGKADASMQEKTGFGVLLVLEVGRRMIIVGDYGVSTTKVSSIKEKDESITVKTMNSTYLIKAPC
jgi:diaminopimelate decarboxylase